MIGIESCSLCTINSIFSFYFYVLLLIKDLTTPLLLLSRLLTTIPLLVLKCSDFATTTALLLNKDFTLHCSMMRVFSLTNPG